MSIPTHLPEDVWGLAGLAIIMLGMFVMDRAKRRVDTTQPVADASARQLQAVADALTQTMNAGFAERDQRIDELEKKLNKVLGKYHVSLAHIRQWRRLHPESVERLPAPVEIESEL